MNQKELKQRLLDTKYFIDNKWLTLYCELILNNLNTINQKYKMQLHHFIPVCYYKILYNCKSRKEAEEFSNKDLNNFKVYLLYKDHILIHYYLCFCTKNLLHYKLLDSYQLTLNHITKNKYQINKKAQLKVNELIKKLPGYQKLYEELSIYRIQKCKELHISNKGKHRTEEQKMRNRVAHLGLYLPGKSVICIELNKIFKSIAEANRYLGFPPYSATIRDTCLHKQKTARGYHWAYIEDKETINKLSYLYKGKPPKSYHNKVFCLELDKTFDSLSNCVKYFKKYYNLKINPWDCCKGKAKTTKGYHFCYLKDKNNYIFSKHSDGRTGRDGKHVLCVETGIEYVSVGEAVRQTGIKSISAVCRNVKGYPRAGGFHWKFVE